LRAHKLSALKPKPMLLARARHALKRNFVLKSIRFLISAPGRFKAKIAISRSLHLSISLFLNFSMS
jgi:hypothetical protein